MIFEDSEIMLTYRKSLNEMTNNLINQKNK